MSQEADLEALKAEHQKTRLSAFDLMREYNRMSAEELRHSGWRVDKYNGDLEQTRRAAIQGCLENALRDIDRSTKAFLKKWPD